MTLVLDGIVIIVWRRWHVDFLCREIVMLDLFVLNLDFLLFAPLISLYILYNFS